MNWHEELLKRGFTVLESSTKTYGYYYTGRLFFTGSIVFENSKNNIADEPGKDTKEIFCPFIHEDDERKPNTKFQTVRLRNMEEVDKHIKKI